MKATRLVLIAILSFPLLSAAKKDPCQAVDNIKIKYALALKAARFQGHDTLGEYVYFKDKKGGKFIVIEEMDAFPGGEYNDIFIFGKDYLPSYFGKDCLPSDLVDIKKKMKSAYIIDDSYFTTQKGVHLAMGIDEIISIYGKPDKKRVLQKSPKVIVKYEWDVPGSIELENYEPISPNENKESAPRSENNNNEKLQANQDINAKNEKQITQIINNSRKSLTDRIYQNDFDPITVLSTETVKPREQPPEKPIPKEKICKKVRVGVDTQIIFVDGKAVLIWIEYLIP